MTDSREEPEILFETPCTTEEENSIKKKLEKQGSGTSNNFFVHKCLNQQKRNWDLAYKSNTINAYKDRHYLDKEFFEIKNRDAPDAEFGAWIGRWVSDSDLPYCNLCIHRLNHTTFDFRIQSAMESFTLQYGEASTILGSQWTYTITDESLHLEIQSDSTLTADLSMKNAESLLIEICHDDEVTQLFCRRQRVFLETGCGVGNALFPLMEVVKDLYYYAFDFSPRAIDFLKKNELYDEERCYAFVCNFVSEDFPPAVYSGVDFILVLFVLSAIKPEERILAVQRIFASMFPGGFIFLRDYGRYDLAQIRFKAKNQLSKNLYGRQDGTLTYFFTLEEIQKLFEDAGFETVQLGYVRRLVENRKRENQMKRVWIQAKFRKPV